MATSPHQETVPKSGAHLIRTGILTVSDSCFQGLATDHSGENIKRLLESGELFTTQVTVKDIVPDDFQEIKNKLCVWSDNLKLDVILTTGGTGFSHRDVTPEATKSVLEREAIGMVVAMLTSSLGITPLAMLSRPCCGTRGHTLIINLPGSAKGSEECLRVVSKAIHHAVDLLRGFHGSIQKVHQALQEQQVVHQHSHEHKHHHHLLPRRHAQQGSQGPYPPEGQVKGGNHHHGHLQEHSHSNHSEVSTRDVAKRARESPYPMVTVDQAVAMVLGVTPVLEAITVTIADALGLYLAEDVYAKDPLPPFPASIKDGYAVVAADGAGLRKVIGESSAGDVPGRRVMSGGCVRINTGAAVPPGADAVVQVEDTRLEKEEELTGEEAGDQHPYHPDTRPGHQTRWFGYCGWGTRPPQRTTFRSCRVGTAGNSWRDVSIVLPETSRGCHVHRQRGKTSKAFAR
ncbi:hypothetical protein C0Q70_13784 [Pomacea canaliculata]|uniref:MoaB/Mog domain-containing protein n=1 Tax=Pomacea canaliculata TaxID=400727 RepID=A0A2T7NY81_POMCA|nr:hypothetical protein C0Q70_13784 [Pomacea canaliculata]